MRNFPIKKLVPLSLDERKRLKEIIADPVFERAIELAHNRKPSVYAPYTGSIAGCEPNALAANNRLHQIQGWEMFEAAFYGQLEEIVYNNKQLEETYPDAGRSYE